MTGFSSSAKRICRITLRPNRAKCTASVCGWPFATPDPTKGEVVQPTIIAAPRGFAKSTLLVLARVLWLTLTEQRKYCIIGSETKDLAADHVLDIAVELAENERIIYDFGQQLKYAPKNPDIVLANGRRIQARGARQALRGVKKREQRPDDFIGDDLESDEGAKSPNQVEKTLNWLTKAVYPALDPEGSMVVIGTIISQRAALATLIHSEEEPWNTWSRHLFRAYTDDGQSSWPAKYPLEILKAQERKMGTRAWRSEKMNDPIDESDFFQLEWIKTYDMADLPTGLYVSGFYDPAKGQGGDFAANITLGYDQGAGLIYVLDAWIRRQSVNMALAAALARHIMYGYVLWGMETNGFQALALEILPELEKKAGAILPVIEVNHSTNKGLRIESLSPFIERGKLLFCPEQGDQKLLIQQLTSYPRGHDDGPDALEGALALLRGKHNKWPSGVLPVGLPNA